MTDNETPQYEARLDEYKFFAERTEKFAEVRTSTSTQYVTLVVGIFGVAGFLIKDANLKGIRLGSSLGMLAVVGCLVCYLWARYLEMHGKYMTGRYKLLREMEKELVARGAFGFYEKEHIGLFSDKAALSFSDVEASKPGLFGVLFAVGAVLAVLLLVLVPLISAH